MARKNNTKAIKSLIQLKKNPELAMLRSVSEMKETAKNIAEIILSKKIAELEVELKKRMDGEIDQMFTDRFDIKISQRFKGEIGSQGPKGDRGDTIIGPQGEEGRKGDRGDRGLDGITPKPLTFLDLSKKQKLELQGEKGDAKEDNAEEIKEKLQSLVGAERIDASAIKNLPRGGKRGMSRGGGLAANKVDNFTSLTDGATKVFTLSFEPKAGTVMLYSTQFPVIYDPDTDFTISGLTVTLTSAVGAPQTGQTLVATYQKNA